MTTTPTDKILKLAKRLTIPLPPDPDEMNDERAQWAMVAVEAFLTVCATDKEDAIADLICNLGHLCDRDPEFGPFKAALDRAERNYDAETMEDLA